MSQSVAKSTFKRFFSAITSRKKAAYVGMFVILVGPITRLLDKLFFKKKEKPVKLSNCLVVLGQSRSGSTIAFQVLSRILDARYISNRHVLFPNHSNRYVRKYNGKLLTEGFNNYYGYTPQFYDVSEGNPLMDKLFKKPYTSEVLRERFELLYNQVGGDECTPFIFKNIKYTEQLPDLLAAVPEIGVIKIERNLEMIGQSSIKAYHDLGNFNPTPPQLKNDIIEDPYYHAGMQVSAMDKLLNEVVESIPDSRSITISYEAFCTDTELIVERINTKLLNGKVKFRWEALQTGLRASNKNKLSNEQLKRFKQGIQEFHERI